MLWVGVVILGVTTLLFGATALSTLAEDPGGAVVGLVATALVATGLVACVRALRRSTSGPGQRAVDQHMVRGPATADSVPQIPRRVTVREPVRAAAAPSSARRAPGSALFGYASDGRGREHDGTYAVIDVETTGLSPQSGDRIIEVAIQRVDISGRVEDEFATLINPEGRDTGPVFIHGISNNAVARAPEFGEVADEVLSRLDGAVVVAHNAGFEEKFLGAEFAAAGRHGLRMPALDTLWLARQTFDTPNHKLGTLAQAARVPLVDKHSALGDVRALGQLLPHMLDRRVATLRYADEPMRWPTPRSDAPLNIVTRAAEMRRGTEGWMHSLISRLPMSANEVQGDVAEAYFEMLATALEDGKIIGEEARALAKLAGSAGLGGAQVQALNERFLEGMREAAFSDDVLTAPELASLTNAARALAVPTYFDDLRPTEDNTREVVAPAPRVRRCGHCRQPGHYCTKCPELAMG